ncbi:MULTISPECIES: hypothetical protein [unclassified Amycolatopsis]|uniref:hypothetical protein n=1 Tax=unclassified Amycolatopsis TaxID=2618356 RepID=UPI002875FEFB|nr:MULTISPECIES: hypothetical protein [unclassified Amycolatopsis]MDS0137584.1 hypothetical protein [Amycolatopsis sp. 505]MDS0141779.1 hypothetical protein [Amycolatopsis sp. CM201R]
MVAETAWTTLAERQGARAWLARHGVTVGEPTPLLAVRVGARELATRSYQAFWVLSPVANVVALLPPVPVLARYLVVAVVCTAYPLLMWRRVRRADRAAARLVPPGVRLPFREAAGQVGRWYFAAMGVTFGGGVVLCAVFAAHPVGWAAALVIGVACSALVLERALRAPVLAEDTASAAVDAALRAYDTRAFMVPFLFTFLPWVDLSADWPWPPARIVPVVAYFVLAVAVYARAAVEFRNRRLPPGHYGTVTA